MEDSMMDMAEMVFDEKVSTKRVREDEDEKDYVGRLEKRPSGILVKEEEENKNGSLNQFLSSLVSPKASELDVDVQVEVKNDDLSSGGGGSDGIGGGDGGSGGGESNGGGGIITNLISNIFHHNDLGDRGNGISCGDGGDGGGGEEKEGIEKDGGANDIVSDMPDKKPPSGCKSKIRPDNYSERVFFLNNN